MIPLEALIALNDEMAALVRAGVPLEEGLAALGGDTTGLRHMELAQLPGLRLLAHADRQHPPARFLRVADIAQDLVEPVAAAEANS